jgi:hypothetical protein
LLFFKWKENIKSIAIRTENVMKAMILSRRNEIDFALDTYLTRTWHLYKTHLNPTLVCVKVSCGTLHRERLFHLFNVAWLEKQSGKWTPVCACQKNFNFRNRIYRLVFFFQSLKKTVRSGSIITRTLSVFTHRAFQVGRH